MKTYLTLATFAKTGDIVRFTGTDGKSQFFIVVGRNGSGHIVEKIGWLARNKILLANRVKRAYASAKDFILNLRR